MNLFLEMAREKLRGKVLAVMSTKGGVGKSIIASLIALNLSEKQKTSLIDLDIYGNSILKLFGIRKLHKISEEGIEPFVIGNLSIYSIGGVVGDHYIILPSKYEGNVIESLLGLAKIKDNLIVIDMPPGMGEELLTLLRIVNPEIILITLPSKLSVRIVKHMLDFLIKSGLKPKAIIANMAFLEFQNELFYPFGKLDYVYELGREYGVRIECLPIDPSIEDFIGKIQEYSGKLKKSLKFLELILS